MRKERAQGFTVFTKSPLSSEGHRCHLPGALGTTQTRGDRVYSDRKSSHSNFLYNFFELHEILPVRCCPPRFSPGQSQTSPSSSLATPGNDHGASLQLARGALGSTFKTRPNYNLMCFLPISQRLNPPHVALKRHVTPCGISVVWLGYRPRFTRGRGPG